MSHAREFFILGVITACLLTACAIFGEKVETFKVLVPGERFVKNHKTGQCYSIVVQEIHCEDLFEGQYEIIEEP